MANVVNMAALAWSEEAKKCVIYKMANITASQARFRPFLVPITIGCRTIIGEEAV